MAETKAITLEGEVKLAYFNSERDSKHILIQPEGVPSDGPMTSPIGERRLESFIADQLGFPNDSEFDAMFRHLDDLRKRGLRPAEGVPDCEREGVRVRITLEVL
jgi:hypothetical protein